MTIEPIPHNVEKQRKAGRQRLRWTDNIESVPNQISVPSYELAKTAPLAIILITALSLQTENTALQQILS